MNFIPAVVFAFISYAFLFTASVDFKRRRWSGALWGALMFLVSFGISASFVIGDLQ